METTGLADPGNIAPLFWVDEGLGSSIYLDGVVTLVDAKNLLRLLDDTNCTAHSSYDLQSQMCGAKDDSNPKNEKHPTTALLQISHADVIVVNKADLVTQQELQEVIKHIRAINLLAKLHVTTKSQVPQLDRVLLDLHAYDDIDTADVEFAAKGHSHHDQVRFTQEHLIPNSTALQNFMI